MRLKKRIILQVFIILIVLSSFISASTYKADGINDRAWFVESNSLPPNCNSNNFDDCGEWREYSTSDYNKLSELDDNFAVFSGNKGTYELSFHEFKIDESPENMEEAEMFFTGYSNTSSGNLYVYDYVNEEWIALGSVSVNFKNLNKKIKRESAEKNIFDNLVEKRSDGNYLLFVMGARRTGFSCPFVYSYDGEYHFDHEAFPFATSPLLESDSYGVLRNLKEVDGKYRIKISEELDEVSYIDSFRLKSVDYTGEEIMVDVDGEIHTIGEKINPDCSYYGEDCSGLLKNFDEDYWESDKIGEEDYIELEFDKKSDFGKFFVRSKAGELLGEKWDYYIKSIGGNNWGLFEKFLGFGIFKQMFLSKYDETKLKVELFVDDEWKEIGKIEDGRERWRESLIGIDLSEADYVRIRLKSYGGYHQINEIYMDFTPDNYIEVNDLKPINEIKELGKNDGNYLVLEKGDEIELEYLAEETDMKRGFVMEMRGYYNAIVEEKSYSEFFNGVKLWLETYGGNEIDKKLVNNHNTLYIDNVNLEVSSCEENSDCEICGCEEGLICQQGECKLFDETSSGFFGQYYNNKDLSGTPDLERIDKEINFNWGNSNPASEIEKNKFSVRWVKNENFASGKYMFTTQSDDGIRVWVDNNLIINNWDDHSVKTDTAEIDLDSGVHEIKVEYYENKGKAVAKLSYEPLEIYEEGACGMVLSGTCSEYKPLYCYEGNLSFNCQLCNCSSNRICLDSGECVINETDFPDYLAEYYNNKYLEGTPVLVQNDKEINFNWDRNSPNSEINEDEFSVRWSKTQDFASGSYNFTTQSDDGIKVWIDKELIIERWNDHSVKTDSELVNLSSGLHDIVVEYYENKGRAVAKFNYDIIEIYEPGACDDGTLNNTCSVNKPYFCMNSELKPLCQICGCYDEFICKAGECIIDTNLYPNFMAEYYNNKYLEGDSVLTRNDELIDFNWKKGSPAEEINNDEFSVRWLRQEFFEAGEYRFITRSDDGIKVWIDKELIIERWNDHSATTDFADVVLDSGTHLIEIEFYENKGNALASFSYEVLSLLPSPEGKLYWTNLIGEQINTTSAGSKVKLVWEPEVSLSSLPDFKIFKKNKNLLGSKSDIEMEIVDTRTENKKITGKWQASEEGDYYFTPDEFSESIPLKVSGNLNNLPFAIISYPNEGGKFSVGQNIQFRHDSYDEDDEISVQWDFGDGTTSEEEEPVYSYDESGEKTVTLTVTDDRGGINTEEVSIYAAQSKGGLISNVTGAEPFYTWGGNPRIIQLTENQSQVLTWVVNATGLGEYAFFAIVNKSSNKTINNVSNIININVVEAPDSEAPNIFIIQPQNTTYQSTSFEFAITTDEPCSSCSYTLDEVGEAGEDGDETQDKTSKNNKKSSTGIKKTSTNPITTQATGMISINETYFTGIASGLSESGHNVYFNCTDLNSNTGGSDKIHFTANTAPPEDDTRSPAITLNAPENGYSRGTGNVIFNYTVSDESEIGNCSLIINDNIVSTDETIERNTEQLFTRNFGEGSYNWRIECVDEFNNLGSSETRSLTITSGSGDSCFPAGTRILMRNGEKNIEDVKIGDEVVSYDFETNEKKIAKVLELESPVRRGLYEINDFLNVTDEHPFYVEKNGKKGWAAIDTDKAEKDLIGSELEGVKVYELEIGDKLFTSDGNWIEIETIDYYDVVVKTYNLKTVDKYNVFFAENVLVHNKDGGGCTDTCNTFGYECGNWTICNEIENCGACSEGSSCNSAGKCVEGCQSDWRCDEWSRCSRGVQTRNCTDINECVYEEKIETRQCCVEDWNCDWDEVCVEGYLRPRNCTDVNNCSTRYDHPEPIPCNEDECKPDYACPDWSECDAYYTFEDILAGIPRVEGKRDRTCVDTEGCVGAIYQRVDCEIGIPIETEKVEWCYETYVEIYDVSSNERKLVSRMKERDTGGAKKIDIDFLLSDFEGFCPYCYDGIQNYDEIGLDCGGSCPNCIEVPDEKADIFDWMIYLLWILLLLLILTIIYILYRRYKQRNDEEIKKIEKLAKTGKVDKRVEKKSRFDKITKLFKNLGK